MKISYGWIREFVDLDLTPEQAADRLVNAGIEVASVTPLAPAGLRGVVVGEIEAVERDEIARCLSRPGTTVAAAAAELGISRATIYRRMARLGITAPK